MAIRTAIFALLLAAIVPFAAIAQGISPSAPAPEQSEPDAANAPSQNDIQELLRLLGDQRVLDWLKSNAESGAPAAPGDSGQSFRGEIEQRLAAARHRIAELTQAWSNFPLIPDVLANAWRSELDRGEALRSLIYVIVFLFVGGGLEWLFWQYFHHVLVRIEHSSPVTLLRRLSASGSRLMLQASALAIFAFGSAGAFLGFGWPPFLERVVVNLLLGVIGIRALLLLSRFVLAPRNPDLRLVPLSDGTAVKVHRWHLVIAFIFVSALLVSDTLNTLARTASGSREAVAAALAVSVTFGIATVAALLAMIWSMTPSIARENVLAVANRRRFQPVAFKLVPVIQSVVLVLVLLLWIFDARELMWTVLIVGMLFPAAKLVRAMVDHFFDQAERQPEVSFEEDRIEAGDAAPGPAGEGSFAPVAEVTADMPATFDAEPAIAAEPGSERYAIYRPIVRRFARFMLAALALFVLGEAWGTNLFSLSESPSLAGRAVKALIDIVAVLLIIDLVWAWARTAIDRRLSGYVAPPPGEPPGPEARMATLLPLIRNILLVTVIIVGGLTILSSVGVNIAPLLAGAGIVGVAIGFGTQSLVRDIVSGIFFLLDDAFRVGEYIEIGDLRGTVESMSLRSMRVRHHRGAVHTIPFGELSSLTNYSRDWVIMKLEFRVPFDTDLRLVKKLVKQVGAELQVDPNYGAQIIETLKSQGVRRMEEFNMVVGVKFMARPGAQWVIRRDAYQKLRDAFEKHGINFAQRNVKVEVLSDRPLPDEVRESIAGAAQDAIEQRQPATAMPDEP